MLGNRSVCGSPASRLRLIPAPAITSRGWALAPASAAWRSARAVDPWRCGLQSKSSRGVVVATDLETDFLAAEAKTHPSLEVLRHDVMADVLPTGFDLVHARWLIEWLPDKHLALERMVAALRPGGVILIEEPDFVTIYEAAEPAALRRVVVAAMHHLEATTPVEVEYGRRALGDLLALGLVNVESEGRCPIVRGGHPLAAHFLRFTLEKFREPLVAGGKVTAVDFAEALAVLVDPAATVVAPMTVAAWGRRAESEANTFET